MWKNILGPLAIATALALGTTSPETHAQSAQKAVEVKTQTKVADICALGITVREQGINLCDEIARQAMIKEIADTEEKHLYEKLALIFASLLASGLAGKKLFNIYKKQQEARYERERAEYGNHGELSGKTWEEAMKATASWESDSTNPEHTGMDHELEAKIWAIEEARRIQRAKRAKNAPKWSKESSDWNEGDFEQWDTNSLWDVNTIIQDDPSNNNDTTGDALLESLKANPDGVWVKKREPENSTNFHNTEIPSEWSEADTIGKSWNTAPSGTTTNWEKTVAMNAPDTVGTRDNWTKTVTIETPPKKTPEATTEENNRTLDIPIDLEKILESNWFEINKNPETGEISIRVGKEWTNLSILNTVLKEDWIQTEKTIIKYDEIYHIENDVKWAELVYFWKIPYMVAHMKLIYKNDERLFIQINIAKA